MHASGPLDHLWLHFTRDGRLRGPADLQVIVKGDGCYLEDSNGRRYLDALAGLFCVNIGYGYGEEMGEAAAAQMRELPFAINWTFAHPRAIELAGELASLTPGDLNRAFFVSGGSEAVEAAWKLARQYHRRPRRAALEGDRPPHGLPRHHHGRALDHRLHRAAHALRAARPGRAARVQHEPLPPPARRRPRRSSPRFLLDDLEATIEQAGPDTVAMVIMEPVQNSGGSFMPPAGYFEGVRAHLRRARHPALRRRGHHGLRAHRPLVRLGALRHPARPDHLRQGALVRLCLDRRA